MAASDLIPKPPFPIQCWAAIGIFTGLTIFLFILNYKLRVKDPKDPKKTKSNRWIIFLIVISIACLIFISSGCVWVHNKSVQLWEATVGAVDDAQEAATDAAGELGDTALGELGDTALGELGDTASDVLGELGDAADE